MQLSVLQPAYVYTRLSPIVCVGSIPFVLSREGRDIFKVLFVTSLNLLVMTTMADILRSAPVYADFVLTNE